MDTYTVYTRSWTAYLIFLVVYFMLILIVAVTLTDRLPEYADTWIPGLWVCAGPFINHFLAQVSSRLRIDLKVDKGIIYLQVPRHNFFLSCPPPEVLAKDIKTVTLSGNALTGNYVKLQLANGKKLILRKNAHFLAPNPSFLNAVYLLNSTVAAQGNDAIAAENTSQPDMVAVQRSKGRAILLSVLLLLFWGFFGVFLPFGAILSNESMVLVIFLSTFGFGIGYFLLRTFKRNMPFVVATKEAISFNNKSYQWKEINYSFSPNNILFKPYGETAFSLYDVSYENLQALRTFIRQLPAEVQAKSSTPLPPGTPADLTKPQPVTPIIAQNKNLPKYRKDAHDVKYQNIRYFKGNPVLSMNGFLIWVVGFVPVIALFLFLQDTALTIILLLVLSFPMLIALSFSFNYFGLTEKYLVVKNHHFFWRTNAYLLADISEVVFEESRNNKCATILFEKYAPKRIPGASLSNKDWLAFKTVLASKGVAVRDEINFDDLVKPEVAVLYKRMYIGYATWAIVFSVPGFFVADLPSDTWWEILVKLAVLLATLTVAIFSFIGMLWWARGGSKKED